MFGGERPGPTHLPQRSFSPGCGRGARLLSHPGNRAPPRRFCSGHCSGLAVALTLRQHQDGIAEEEDALFRLCGWIHGGWKTRLPGQNHSGQRKLAAAAAALLGPLT